MQAGFLVLLSIVILVCIAIRIDNFMTQRFDPNFPRLTCLGDIAVGFTTVVGVILMLVLWW